MFFVALSADLSHKGSAFSCEVLKFVSAANR